MLIENNISLIAARTLSEVTNAGRRPTAASIRLTTTGVDS